MKKVKKDKSLNYRQMNYKGKYKRTKVMIPITLLACILVFFISKYWIIYDIIMIVALVWQLLYTRNKMLEEEKELQ
ncbi:MAG: hypothetical protein Q4B36_07560 [Tissierellia bacterium]|nr:hypothetical protein [Tissierellia bacterium]